MESYLKALTHYADFHGRARRKEYWMFSLISGVFTLALLKLDHLLGLGVAGFGPIAVAYSLAVVTPSVAVTVRRLHDIDRSGWWILVGLVPIIGSIILIVFAATSGGAGVNRYGPDPKAVESTPAMVA